MREEVSLDTQTNKQQTKSIRAQTAICESTIQSLVEVGYSETSLNRVAAQAGFSKGALQHHFSSKEELIAATLDRLLERPFHATNNRKAKANVDSVEDALMIAWKKFVNTPAYRAVMEILNAARTDKQLQLRISSNLLDWGKKLEQQSVDQYESVAGDNEEVVMLLNMTRSFFRGLLIQERYGGDAARSEKYVGKWIELIAPLLLLRKG